MLLIAANHLLWAIKFQVSQPLIYHDASKDSFTIVTGFNHSEEIMPVCRLRSFSHGSVPANGHAVAK